MRGATTAVRDRSTVPLQALFMSNSAFVETQAKGLADAVLKAESDPVKRIRLAYARVFAREPADREIRRADTYLGSYARLLAEEGLAGGEQALGAWSSYAKTLLTANEFLFVD